MSRLTDKLIKKKLITREQLDQAIQHHQETKKPLKEVLIEMKLVKEEDLVKTMSDIFGLPIFCIDKEAVDPSAIGILPYEFAKRYSVFPLYRENGDLMVVVNDPHDLIALDDIKMITNMKLRLMLGIKGQCYGPPGNAAATLPRPA